VNYGAKIEIIIQLANKTSELFTFSFSIIHPHILISLLEDVVVLDFVFQPKDEA
jgi:hypothetical protein